MTTKARLVFFDARVWRYVISAISKVIEEGVFVIDNDGFRFRAMDPSRVLMVDLRFPPESFEEFEANERVEIGVNLEDVAKVLRRAVKDDKFVLEAEESKFSIIFLGRSTRKFVMPMLDVSAEDIPEPTLEFKATARLMSDVYRDMIKDLELIGENIKFYTDGQKFVASSSSELGEVEVEFSIESGSLLELEAEGEQSAMYGLEYFSDLASAARVADAIVIKFSSDMPAEITHELPQGAKFSFIIAPRVE
ncbi:proliferating cell nuclear antigen PcnA [Pyrolobus fumarii 1A]|uniref:DNA polymerase sliding clamp n=1 Tax=Pyrolobus fumarii (strain DSM 11204 / 1A) TaxID=694429 RepID=G0EEU0_PYRF1|nr:proliferating cell nuclear antigen (pcna) [Pyrolobus fumarii]AEM38054.1 proliferating cell nuclear antigen PcnA [Pyrolobus fumarii 1A]